MLLYNDLKKIFKNKRVAVVGNADSLFKQRFGREIENHELVCRINQGPLASKSKTHGNRTDVLFYGDPGIITEDTLLKLNNNTIHILTHTKFADRPMHSENLYMISQSLLDEIQNKHKYDKKGQWPSTGLMAVELILNQNPDTVSLFGFDWKQTPTFYRKDDKGDGRHVWKFEQNYLSNHNKIKIFH